MKVKAIVAAAAMAALGGAASAATVDLSGWSAEGGGSWNLQSGANAVKQSLNGDPTVFHNNSASSQGNDLRGTIKVETTADDDYIGFVLGYNAGDLTNASADYLLIDWKQGTQNYYGVAQEGLAISRVTGVLSDNSGAWSHDPANNVTELARGINLGSTGWDDNTEYSFRLDFTATNVKVFVDDVLELDIMGSFADGGFGFYNYSQANVLYAGITSDPLPPAIPLPATLPLLLTGLIGVGALYRKKAA